MSFGTWTLAIVGVLSAPVTGGASLLLAAPLVKEEWDKNENKNTETKSANQQANLALEAGASKEIKEELKRLREDLEKQKNKKKEAEDGIKQYEDIKNDPKSSKADKEHAEQMIKFFQQQLDDSNNNTKALEKKIEDLLKDLPRGNTGSDLSDMLEMKTSTKVVIAGATVLLVYLIFIRDDKKK